jgi:hypothetical protein
MATKSHEKTQKEEGRELNPAQRPTANAADRQKIANRRRRGYGGQEVAKGRGDCAVPRYGCVSLPSGIWDVLAPARRVVSK